MSPKTLSWLLISALIVVGPPVLAKTTKEAQSHPPQASPQAEKAKAKEEPEPLKVLKKMFDFLKSQQQFTYKAEIADDQVFEGGKKLQYGIDMETFVRRPDRLRVNAEGDLVDKQFFFNGKSITLYDKNDNVYGTLDVPPNIESALEKASKDFGVRVALTDLASPQLWDLLKKRIKHSLYVGVSKVRGVPCHHLSLDGEGVQLQVWIQTEDQPLLRKAVLTHKNLPGSPQWIAYLFAWNFSPQLNDKLFSFTPPKGVEKIKFVPVATGKAPKSKPKKKRTGGKS